MKLYCNVHHKMNAFLWVVETPFAQVLDGRTGLEFTEVPAGSYLLKLWHPETGERSFPVTIGDGPTRGSWTLSASLPAFEPHRQVREGLPAGKGRGVLLGSRLQAAGRERRGHLARGAAAWRLPRAQPTGRMRRVRPAWTSRLRPRPTYRPGDHQRPSPTMPG